MDRYVPTDTNSRKRPMNEISLRNYRKRRFRKFGILREAFNCVFETKLEFKWSQLKLQNDPCTFLKPLIITIK